MNVLHNLLRHIHPLTAEERREVTEEIASSISSRFDFFLLVVLSCSIATMGLVTDSPAVIIGAMLVAPLMSPIIGLGLASITSDSRLARTAFSALLSGAGLAVLLSLIMTFVNRHLPFVFLQELPGEVIARTHPSPIDLIIALAGGLAAAYAMTRPNISAALPGVAIATALMPPLCAIGIGLAFERWDVAGGAALLFLTNAITIAFAAALVFFLSGFAPRQRVESNHAPRTLWSSALLTVALLVPLTLYSVKFFNEANDNRNINDVASAEVASMNGAELVELEVQRASDGLNMVVTIRTNTPLRYEQVVQLQEALVARLRSPISLKVNQVFAERLDPLIPPTLTPTTTPTLTNTPGPSPTATFIPTATATLTSTPSPTPTLAMAQVVASALPQLRLYQSPGGPVVGSIRVGQSLTVLYGREEYGGILWVQVMDQEGRIGWIPEIYLMQVTPTPIATNQP